MEQDQLLDMIVTVVDVSVDAGLVDADVVVEDATALVQEDQAVVVEQDALVVDMSEVQDLTDLAVVDASVDAGLVDQQMGEVACDEELPETCVCEPSDENMCQEEVTVMTEQKQKSDEDSCNQMGVNSPLIFALVGALLMRKASRLF